jgi:hypothetical protein
MYVGSRVSLGRLEAGARPRAALARAGPAGTFTYLREDRLEQYPLAK